MRPFQFEPLKSPGSEIRLLEVLPGTRAIHCRLLVTPLEAARGKYEPLSYCWGDQTRRADIVVNDNCTLSIGADLNAALLRLRYQHTARVLWVDAICINQADNSEKNAQVPLMTRIYPYGRRTLVWLGEHDSKTAAAFNIIEFIAAHARDHPREEKLSTMEWVEMYWRATPKYSFSRIAQAPFVAFIRDSKATSQLESVFGRPWFRRVWVIQEISTPSEALVTCGAYQISWETIETAYAACNDNWHRTNDYLWSLIEQRNDFQTSVNNTLTDKILNSSISEATDPRDRIYAILGLVSSGSEEQQNNHGITIDYGAEINEVFKETTAHCIRITSSPNILAGSAGCLGYQLPGLPSWALYPGGANSPYYYRHLMEVSSEGAPGWMVGGPSGCRPVFDATRGLLGVSGLVLDKIASVGSPRGDLTGSRGSVTGLAKWFRSLTEVTHCYFEWRALAGVRNEQLYRWSSESKVEAFRRTLFAGEIMWDEDITTAESQEQFRRFERFMLGEFPFLANRPQARARMRDELRIYLKYVKFMLQAMVIEKEDFIACSAFEAGTAWCKENRFVVTERGYMGIASRAREGDCVVLLAGATMPFILRPDGPASTVVGDCYIHGIMYGEAWDESMCDMIWIK